MATCEVVIYVPGAGSPQRCQLEPALITERWLRDTLDSSVLEAVPCEDDAWVDATGQPLAYLLVDGQGYVRDKPRNYEVERVHPFTVSLHTRCPTDERRSNYVGLHGTAVLLPRTLVPRCSWPRWSEVKTKQLTDGAW